MRKKHPWTNTPICRIDVSGFLSILFFFLAILLVDVCLGPDLPANVVSLPNASHLILLNDAARDDAIHIYVERDGRLYIGSVQVSRDELPGKILEAIRQGSRPVVFISADSHARYRDVSSTLERIQAAGVTRIAFLANSHPKIGS